MRATSCRLLLSALMVLVLASAGASGETYLLDRTFGGQGQDMSKGIAMDDEGNVYVAGSFTGTVDFGGGDRTAAGMDDLFIVKLDGDGKYLWDYTAGGVAADDVAYAIKVDSHGDVLVCGSFQESVDFGGGQRASVGGQDIFVLKLDPDGGRIWDRTFGNRNNQAAVALAVDGDDNVIVTGRYRNPIDFGGGVRPPAGRRDMFLVKLDSDGSYLWDRTVGGEGRDSGRRVAVDSDDNIYVVGSFEYTVDFGGGERTEGNTAYYDGYLLKLDPDGGYLADDTWGGAGEDAVWGVAVCPGGVCVTGYFEETVDFGGGERSSAGSWDICIVRYDADCEYIWDTVLGGTGEDYGYDVAAASGGYLYVAGTFEGTVDLGGGERTSAGGRDVFVLRIDQGGGYLWDAAFGGDGAERVDGLVADLFRGMYVTGFFNGTVDFGGGERTSNGDADVYVLKHGVPVPATVDLDPNTLNLRSNGRWITCYVELMEGFDAADIDVASVRLAGVPAEARPSGIGDYDDDGTADLMVKFDRAETAALLLPGEDACLPVTGMVGGREFEGSGCIRVIGLGRDTVDRGSVISSDRTVSLEALPNPFNPTVQIAYGVPAPGRVLIQVWDVSGRLVRTLEDAWMAAGSHRTEWNGRNDAGGTVASGIYFCRLSVGGDAATRKLMLIR